jgi:uncharacterized protein with HEPN domain
MSANRDLESIADMVNAAHELRLVLQNLDFSAFQANREKQLATLYCFVVIGEATKRISPEFRAQHPTVPWRNMAGMRFGHGPPA